MSLLDIILLVPLLFGAYLGFRKGLIIELCTLLALGGGIYIGIKFSDKVTRALSEWFSEPSPYLALVAFGLCFLAVVILVFFFGKWLERFMNLALMKPFNKLLGGVFGLAKTLLFLSVLLVLTDAWISQRNPELSDSLKDSSLLYKPMTGLALRVIPALEYSSIFMYGLDAQANDSTAFPPPTPPFFFPEN